MGAMMNRGLMDMLEVDGSVRRLTKENSESSKDVYTDKIKPSRKRGDKKYTYEAQRLA